MTWVSLASKEWRRRPLRTSVTTGGVALATAALLSLLSFQQGYRAGVRDELDQLGAQVLVVPKGCPYDAASMALHGAAWPCYLKEQYLQEVRAVPGIATAAPVLMTAVADAQSGQAVYVGVESNILALKRNWRIDGSFPEHDGEVLAGAEAARRHGWKIGQQIRLPGLEHFSARLVGTRQPTKGADDNFVYLRLVDAQRQFHRPNELTHILVRLKDPNYLDDAVAQLRGCDAGLSMNVVPLAHVFHTIQSVVNSTRFFLGCLALVALLIAAVGVSNTVLMAVAERTREIGVWRALGASPRTVFALVWLETLGICLAGGVTGVLLAFTGSRAVEGWVRGRLPFAPAGTLLQWHWWTAAFCVTCALLLGSLAGFLPAWNAMRISPSTAIRSRSGWT